MYTEELKEQENMASSDGVTDPDDNNRNVQNQAPTRPEDRKPTPDRLLVRIDSECVSSIINNADHKNDSKTQIPQEQCLGRVNETYGSMELDFSSYSHQPQCIVSYANENANQSFNGGGGVSLTLGLQQHGGNGVSLAFPAGTQSSLFYQRGQMEDCQPVQYSLLDAGEGQNLPYRNLVGAQLLHDLAG